MPVVRTGLGAPRERRPVALSGMLEDGAPVTNRQPPRGTSPRLSLQDQHLVAILEARVKALVAVVNQALAYRNALVPFLTALRTGADPSAVRPLVERLDPARRALKRLARGL